MGPYEILRHCILKHERPIVLAEAHVGVVGGHYRKSDNVHNFTGSIMVAYTPFISHLDVLDYYHSCDICQRLGKPSQWDEMSLVPQLTLQTFDKWVVDFMGLINPPSKRTGARYIITATNYLNRWAISSWGSNIR